MANGSTAKIKYYDDNGGWTERKPASLSSAQAPKSISVSNTDFSHLDASEVDKFNELLGTHGPSVAMLQNVSPQALNRIKGNPTAKKQYALLETSRTEQHEEGTVVLLRLGLSCDTTEADASPEGKNMVRALLQLSLRPAGGPSISITILNMEPSVAQSRRVTIAESLLKQLTAADVTMLVSNVAEGLSHTQDLYRELQAARLAAGFVDVIEEGVEKMPATAPAWSMWLKSPKFGVAATSMDLLHGQEPRHVLTSFLPRNAASATITIPMPRSAKSGRNKSPPAAGAATQALTDPAILSAEASKGTVQGQAAQGGTPSSGSDAIMRLMRQQQQQQQQQQHPSWSVAHSFTLKGSDTKLNNAESSFDLSSLFSSPAEAVEELNNKNLNWPADFCVAHNTVLCHENVTHCDRQAFRRYARDFKGNAQLSSQMYAAVSAYTNLHTGGERNAWTKQQQQSQPQQGQQSPQGQQQQQQQGRVEEFAAFHRVAKRDEVVRREWSEACCSIVYQITPREMKFNITNSVGLAKDNLKKAVYLLNRAKNSTRESNPLHDYPYDYALLFSVERQGYWLIAAKQVPCDIVACRMVV